MSLCHDSPDTLDVRLGDRSSDDSLILDEKNTSSPWADSDNEPATFQVHHNSHSANYTPGRSNSAMDFTGEWFKDPWDGQPPKTAIVGGTSPGVFNVSMQTRLSLSGEESEVPLLSSASWLPGGFANDTGHCHPRVVMPSSNLAWRQLMSATVLCLFFMIATFLGGLFSGSVATMTDAAHLLSDLVGLLVSLSAVWLGQRPPTKTLSFGFYRAEVLGTLFSIFAIWVVTGIFIYVATLRIIHGNPDIRADRMMAVAAGGIVINIIMGLVLHGGCQNLNAPHSHGFGHHGHSHGTPESNDDSDSHQISPCLRRSNMNHSGENLEGPSALRERNHDSTKRSNINVRAAAIHVLGDLIQSIGVFIAAVVIKFNPDAKIADPICTFLFAILVLATTIPLLRDTCLILLEGFPRTISYSQVFTALSDIPAVQHIHSLHAWSLTIGKHAISVHLAVDPTADRDSVTSRAQHVLQTKFGIHFCTIQTEAFDQAMMSSCFQCKPPLS